MKHFNSPSSTLKKAAVLLTAITTICALPTYLPAQASPPASRPGPGTPPPGLPYIESRGSVGPGMNDSIDAEFQSFDVRLALAEVFQLKHKSFSIDPSVKGLVTMDLRNLSLESAVTNIVRQVDAKYRIDAKGDYIVTNGPMPRTKPNLPNSVPASYGHIKMAPAKTPPVTFIVNSYEIRRADVREVLRTLFRANGGVSYSIAPDVQGIVTASFKNVRFEDVLKNILRQVDSTYRIDGDVFNVTRK
jgi:type II secretory pathway component GspD/PulD (secretin)